VAAKEGTANFLEVAGLTIFDEKQWAGFTLFCEKVIDVAAKMGAASCLEVGRVYNILFEAVGGQVLHYFTLYP
jgi:hypothetical protein